MAASRSSSAARQRCAEVSARLSAIFDRLDTARVHERRHARLGLQVSLEPALTFRAIFVTSRLRAGGTPVAVWALEPRNHRGSEVTAHVRRYRAPCKDPPLPRAREAPACRPRTPSRTRRAHDLGLRPRPASGIPLPDSAASRVERWS